MDHAEPDARTPVEVLDFATARGVWVVRSASTTCYYVDVDSGLLMRARGEGSQAFPFDDVWVKLVDVTTHSDDSQRPALPGIRVGERARWLTDPRGGIAPYEWRLQRQITAIAPLTSAEVAALGVLVPGGEDRDA